MTEPETNHLSPKEERRLIADCAMWARRAERAEAKLAAGTRIDGDGCDGRS